MDYEDIILTKKEGVATITINRPQKYNSFRSKTLEELTQAFEDVDNDDTIGVAVFRGSGEKAFSTGGDVEEMRDLSPKTGRPFLAKMLRLLRLMRGLSKPIIAAVNGYCLGGGNELNLACDLTIATEKSQFGQVGPTVGSIPVMAGTQMLPRLVGEKKAREIIFLCQRYTATEAEGMGWINRVVSEEDFDKEIENWCKRIMELSPQSLRIAKLSLNFESDALYPSYTHGMEILNQVYATEEFREGMNSFLEKRKPDFAKYRG